MVPPLGWLLRCLSGALSPLVPLPWWSPSGIGSPFFFPLPSSFVVPSPAFTCGAASIFFVCHLQLPLPSGGVFISALRLPLPLFVSFLALFYVDALGLCSVFPGPGFCPWSSTTVLVHLCISFFLWCFLPNVVYIRPFWLFLVSGHALFLFLNLADLFGSQFLHYGVALWA